MNRNLPFMLLLAAFLGASSVYGQFESKSFMIMAKPGKKKSYSYYPGNNINYRLYWNDDFVSDRIIYFTDSSIVFASFSPFLKDINAVKIEKKTYVFSKQSLFYSGVSMLGSVVIWNTAHYINQGEFAPETQGAATFFGIMLGGAIVINLTKKALTKQVYAVGKGQYELRPVVFRPQNDEGDEFDDR